MAQSTHSNTLMASKNLEIRFSEVDSMQFVWHGAYSLYFEDAREAFGKKYGIGYDSIYANGCYAPLVELSFKYERAMRRGTRPRLDISYRPCDAAKLIFDYQIRDQDTNELYATGHTVQVFLDRNYQLMWTNPPFYAQWKKKWIQEK